MHALTSRCISEDVGKFSNAAHSTRKRPAHNNVTTGDLIDKTVKVSYRRNCCGESWHRFMKLKKAMPGNTQPEGAHAVGSLVSPRQTAKN